MRKGINKMVGFRVAAAVAAILLFSAVTTINIIKIDRTQTAAEQTNALLTRAQKAEAAHYKWSSNLSNALYHNTEFTGSIDPTTCILGQWLYGEADTDNKEILSLRSQMEPLHKELHGSATHVLELLQTDPEQAQTYYQDTIQSNLTVLVGMLDKVIDQSSILNDACQEHMESTLSTMHITTCIGLALSLICLISLVMYVLKHIVKPILLIDEKSRPLQDGLLRLDLEYSADNELGDLAETLKKSVTQIGSYVSDINRIMGEFSEGNFNVRTSMPFIGDFRSIEDSISSFTSNISTAFTHINNAEHRVSENAEQLSSGAQALAQGATEQASAVEQLYATLDELSKGAAQNVKSAAHAQENARLTGEQVAISGEQMKQMVAAVKDITDASQQIGAIIKTIEDIAFQTNILALNAAVEAARAGAAGKGFAVVSSEVRSLAAQSDDAVKATKELIENSVQAAKRGSDIVGNVSLSLEKTLELVTKSNDAIGEIAEAVRGEAATIAQVTEGIGQISDVVQTNSASSEESAAVSLELFDQVRLLQDQTKRFNLKG